MTIAAGRSTIRASAAGEEVPRERLVEICNALRERWGSVERIYETNVNASSKDAGIDMDAFMDAVQAAKVTCSEREMSQVRARAARRPGPALR